MGLDSTQNLANLVGLNGMFQYVSPVAQAMLPATHPNASENAYSGTNRFEGKFSDQHMLVALSANHLAACYGGEKADRLPLAGECVLLGVLPSCTNVFDLCVSLSVAGDTHRWLSGKTGAEGAFLTDIGDPTDPADDVTGPLSICEDVVPATASTEAFPPMDLFIGSMYGPRASIGDPQTFASFKAFDGASGAMLPEVGLFGDTGRAGEGVLLWGQFTADVPENSYATVTAGLIKPGQ